MSTDLGRIIDAWMKQEFWTRKEALLILSGFHPDTPLDSVSNPVPGRELYLDGSRQFQRGHIYPENVQYIQNYLNLSFQRSKDQLTPKEWLDWARNKGITPFWLAHISCAFGLPLNNQESPSSTELNNEIAYARKQRASRQKGGKARHENSIKSNERKLVKECWLEWQKNPGNYKNKTAFANDMLKKFEQDNPEEQKNHLSSAQVICNWCRKWEEEKLHPAS